MRFDRAGSFIGQLLKIIPPAPAAASIREADSDAVVDDAADMELEKAIDLGDGVESAPTEGTSQMAAGTAEPQAVPERERPAISARQIEGLFAGVPVRARADRGVVIEAAPEAASALISIFQGMAGLLGGLKRIVSASKQPCCSIPS